MNEFLRNCEPEFLWSALEDDAIAPAKAHRTDAGWDLSLRTDVVVHPNQVQMADLGIAVAVPPGYVGLIYPRSSVGAKLQVGLANTVGVIDADYRGPVKLALRTFGEEPVILEAGQRVAQMVLTPCLLTEAKQVDDLSNTQRGHGGFGSTGT